ncbi:MAG: beta strand repeat-containing protein [Halorhodospira sp.]
MDLSVLSDTDNGDRGSIFVSPQNAASDNRFSQKVTVGDADNNTLVDTTADTDDPLDFEVDYAESFSLTSEGGASPNEDNAKLGTGDTNTINALTSNGSSGDENQLRSLNITANTSVALDAASDAMWDGKAGDQDIFSLNFSGDASANAGQLDIGGNVVGMDVTSDGAGERQVDLSGANSGNLSQASGSDTAEGQGVTVKGDGSGDVNLLFDTADVATGNPMAVDGSDFGGNTVVEITTNNDDDLTGTEFNGVDQVTLDADMTDDSAGVDLRRLEAGTDVLLTNDQTTNALTIQYQDASSVNVDLASDNDADGGIITENASDVTISTTGDDTNTNTVSGFETIEEIGGDTNLGSLTFNVESNETLDVDGDIKISRADELGDSSSFDLNFTGSGTLDGPDSSDLQVNDDPTDNGSASATSRIINDLTIDVGGDVTGDGGGNGQVQVNDLDFNPRQGSPVGDATTLDLNLTGDGGFEVTGNLVVADDTTETLNIDSSGSGDGPNIIQAFDSSSTIDDSLTDLNISGNQDLTLGNDTALDIADDGAQTVNASSFSGDLTAVLERGADGGDDYTVEVGSGDDTYTIENSPTTNDNQIDDDGTATYVFDGSSIGDNTIDGDADDTDGGTDSSGRGFAVGTDNSATDDDAVDDVLDFSNMITSSGSLDFSDLSADGEGDIVDGDGNALLTVDGSVDSNDSVEITAADGQFEGSITLTGVDDATYLNSDNFDFA